MKTYHVETSTPDWDKGMTRTIYTVHDEAGRLRGMQYDVESTANAVCTALNRGEQLTAELSYKLNHAPKTASVQTTYTAARDVLYYHVQDQLSGTTSMSMDHEAHKAQALQEAGYSEPVVIWMPIKE